MSEPNAALSQASRVESSLEPTGGWLQELADLLDRAAQIAAANGIEGDVFKRAAWNAYLDARPGLRQKLEDKELKSQLRKLRKRGLVGLA
jgi:hypothetical protein